MIRDFPLTGLGAGSYIIEVSNYAKLNRIQIEPESAENYLLQVGSELGLVGVLLVLWIFWEIVKQIRRTYSKIPATDNFKFVFIGAVGGIISFLLMVQAHTFIGSYEIKYTFWLLVGIVFCLGRLGSESEHNLSPKRLFSKKQTILSIIVLSLFSGIHLWNSTHSLSLKTRTELLGIKQDFGFYQLEKTDDGREFRWTRGYGGLTLKIEKPVIEIPLLASHPDIQQNPVTVTIYLIKEFFKQKKLLDELTLTQSIWKKYEYDVSQELGQELILLVKISRTWNPLKTMGTPDPRNLGVAIGKVEFKERTDP
jgi:fumarate reductase subunit D